MSKRNQEEPAEEMLPEYDFSEGERGKYSRRFEEGSNIGVIAADLAQEFPDSASVNEALRKVAEERGKQRGFGGREPAV